MSSSSRCSKDSCGTRGEGHALGFSRLLLECRKRQSKCQRGGLHRSALAIEIRSSLRCQAREDGPVFNWPRASPVGRSFTDKKEKREMRELVFFLATSFVVFSFSHSFCVFLFCALKRNKRVFIEWNGNYLPLFFI